MSCRVLPDRQRSAVQAEPAIRSSTTPSAPNQFRSGGFAPSNRSSGPIIASPIRHASCDGSCSPDPWATWGKIPSIGAFSRTNSRDRGALDHGFAKTPRVPAETFFFNALRRMLSIHGGQLQNPFSADEAEHSVDGDSLNSVQPVVPDLSRSGRIIATRRMANRNPSARYKLTAGTLASSTARVIVFSGRDSISRRP
jgi:hypothetical protein